MTFDLAFNNALLISDSLGWEPFVGSFGIKDERIAYVGPRRIMPEEASEIRELDNQLIMPGLTNGHCHGDMTIARGLGDGLTLYEQIEAFSSHNWFLAYLSLEDRMASRELTYAEALLSGCTFLLENMYWSLGADAVAVMSRSGLRGALAEDCRPDFREPAVMHSAEELRIFADLCRQHSIIPVLGSVSEEDFAADVLREARNLAKEADMLLTGHLAETLWRVDIVRERHGTTPVRYLASQGYLGPDLIGSHVVHVDDEEVEMLRASGTKVINTPLCEFKIADGLAPVPAMSAAGIPVGLGTDGAMWNNNIDLFREMKGLLLANSLAHGVRSMAPRDALRMATLGGARAFGLTDTGDLKAGNLADFIILNLHQPKFRPLRLGQFENVSSSLVYNASGEDVSHVFVGGRELVRDRQLLTLNLPDLMDNIQARGETLARKLAADMR